MSIEKEMLEAHAAAQKALAGNFVIVAFEDQGEMFRCWTGDGDAISILKIEAAAHTLLSRLLAEQTSRTDDCASCDQCRSRIDRVQAAIAALSVGPPNPEIPLTGAFH